MTRLAVLTIVIGAVAAGLRLAAAAWPGRARRLIEAFPRSRVAAGVLTAVDLAAVTAVLYATPLGWFEPWKWLLFVLCPVAVVLVLVFVDELLAPRALGGLLLLLAAPVLGAARWHPSDWRLVMSVLAYAWVALGSALVVSPYLFRRLAARLTTTDSRFRAISLAGVATGLVLVALGLFVY